MSNKNIYLKAFNKHFFEFLEELIKVFPENEDIESAKNTFYTFKSANPTSIIKVWYMYVYTPYHEQIDTGNIDFFAEKDYSADLADTKHYQKIMEVIDMIRDPFKNMGDVNKEHSVKYIQNLSKLSVAYCDQ
jgi:hypothetical protein